MLCNVIKHSPLPYYNTINVSSKWETGNLLNMSLSPQHENCLNYLHLHRSNDLVILVIKSNIPWFCVYCSVTLRSTCISHVCLVAIRAIVGLKCYIGKCWCMRVEWAEPSREKNTNPLKLVMQNYEKDEQSRGHILSSCSVGSCWRDIRHFSYRAGCRCTFVNICKRRNKLQTVCNRQWYKNDNRRFLSLTNSKQTRTRKYNRIEQNRFMQNEADRQSNINI